MNASPKNEGFTLIEMLVVLGLAALIISISLPYSTASGDSRKLDAASQIIAAKLRETQSTAIWSNRESAVTFDVTKGFLKQANQSKIYNLPHGMGIKIISAENEVIESSATIRFFPDGGSTGGKIMLGRGNAHREIAINWLTGAVVVSPGNVP